MTISKYITILLGVLTITPIYTIAALQSSAEQLHLSSSLENNRETNSFAQLQSRRKLKQESIQNNTQDLSAQIDSSADKIEDPVEKQAAEILEKLQAQIETLKEGFANFSEEYNIQDIQDEPTESSNEMPQRSDNIEENTYSAGSQATESTTLILQPQINVYEQELKQVQSEIDTLAAQLPLEDNPCNTITSCDDCAANDACGWCLSSNTCIQGNNNGPSYENCPFYDYKICTGGKDCLRFKDCHVS